MSPSALSPAKAASIAHAREVRSHRAAVRALDDPRQIARAARIVREALKRQRLTLADLQDDDQVAS